jgi:outer membrane protein assembly factor BamE (lipoprotein component of BamABCDE complex)
LPTPAYQLKDVTYEDVTQNIVKGRTTKSQVQERFGKPTAVNHYNGQEHWTYNLTQIDPLSVLVGAGKYRNLSVTFKGNVVADYNYSSGGQS